MLKLLVLAGLLSLASAAKPFVQTPEFVQAAFRAAQESQSEPISQLIAGAGLHWRSIGPDRTSKTWADSYTSFMPWGWVVDSGRVRGILQDPVNLNRVFVLFGGGGVWRTDNFYATVAGQPGDTTWRPLTNRLPSNGGAIAFGALSNVLYYAIGDPIFSLIPSTNAATSISGVLVKSLDAGDTWGEPVIINPSVSIVWDLDIIPGCNPDGSQDTVIAATDVGLFTSTNGGATFTRVLPNPLPNPPPNPVGTTVNFWSVIRTTAGWMATGQLTNGGDASVFQSADGITWTSTPVFTFNSDKRVTLFQAVKNSPTESVVYAIVAAPGNIDAWLDIFRSNDGGRTFSALNVLVAGKTFSAPAAAAGTSVLRCVGEQADYNQAMLIDPSDPTRNTFVWAGALGAFRTTDAGATLQFTSHWAPGWGGNECPGSASVSYMHADAHYAIALERPSGVAPRPLEVVVPPARQGSFASGPKPHSLPSSVRAASLPLEEAASEEEPVEQNGLAEEGVEADTLKTHHKRKHSKHHKKHGNQHNKDDYYDKHHDNKHNKNDYDDKPHDNKHKKDEYDDKPREYEQDSEDYYDKPRGEYKHDDYDKPHGEYKHDDYPHDDQKPPHQYYPTHPHPPPGCAKPPPPRPGPHTYDVLFGTDGGIFLSTAGTTPATAAGINWDHGLQNIGISTMLITHIKGTPLMRDAAVIGLQDNGHRMRIRDSTTWELMQTGDGQGQALSQAGGLTAATSWVGVGNWYQGVQGASLADFNQAHLSGSAASFVGPAPTPGNNPANWFFAQGLTGGQGLEGTFGIPTADVDPTGQIFFTRMTDGLYRSGNAGRDWDRVLVFPAPREEEPVSDWNLERVARFHVIAVTAGVTAGTLSVAVVRPSTNNVLVTRNQGPAAGATWTSSSPENIPNWVDDRLNNRATTTSPVWQLRLGGLNPRVFVSSVALPTPQLTTIRPRIAFAEVSAAGIGAFTACAGRGLPDTPVNRILVDGNTVYAATWFGVYRSTDACASFSLLGRGLPVVQVADLYLLPASGDSPAILRAGTWGRGAWELRL